MKIGRNQRCPCGSGEKFKHCHGGVGRDAAGNVARPNGPSQGEVQRMFERLQADARIREEQQGLGRPIIAAKIGEHQLVAVKNRFLWSKNWQSMPDFLNDYIKEVFGSDWGNAEIAKPLAERHILLQWFDEVGRYRREQVATPLGQITTSTVNGVVGCYLGLAYSLYLLDHNVELQDRLVKRLKDPANFQGAYYELIVANSLIRAGFDLTLEDETDGASKHCEFAAVSKATGRKYWVEAKMRGVAGVLGKTTVNGGTDRDPLAQLVPHLNQALAKPAADDRLIFIDVNADAQRGVRPQWADRAGARLERYEQRELSAGATAYLFVTNLPFHRALREELTTEILPYGLGFPDFMNRLGTLRVSDRYRRKQKHIDAFNIGEALAKYPRIPSTFDGRMASEVYDGGADRLRIGDRRFFAELGEEGQYGVVANAVVDKTAKIATFGINTDDGNGHLMRAPMTDAQIADYKAHPTAYFGQIVQKAGIVTTTYDFFERMMEHHKGWSREKLLARVASIPGFDVPADMSTDDLRAEYCERLTGACVAKGFKLDEEVPPMATVEAL